MVEYREACLARDRFPISNGEGANGIIEGAPQILKNVAREQHDVIGDDFPTGEVIDYFSRLRITLYSNAVRLQSADWIKKGIDCRVQFLDALLGPLDLGFGTIHIPPF